MEVGQGFYRHEGGRERDFEQRGCSNYHNSMILFGHDTLFSAFVLLYLLVYLVVISCFIDPIALLGRLRFGGRNAHGGAWQT